MKIGQAIPLGGEARKLLVQGKTVATALSLAAITILSGCASVNMNNGLAPSAMSTSPMLDAQNVTFGKILRIKDFGQRSYSNVSSALTEAGQQAGTILGRNVAGATSSNPLTQIAQRLTANVGGMVGRSMTETATATPMQTLTIRNKTGGVTDVTQPAGAFHIGQRVAVGYVNGRQQVFDAVKMLQVRPELQSHAANQKPSRPSTYVASSLKF